MTICASTSTIDLDSKDWSLDLDALESLIRPNTKLIAINFPHNPTGAILPAESLERLVHMCRKHSIWLFSDEVYRGLQYTADEIPPVAAIYEKGISLGVVSKALGLAGLRIGWIVCSDLAALKDIANVKHYLSICNSAPSEILALIALRNQNIILQDNTSIAVDNLALFEVFLARWTAVFSWVKPKGACCG